MKKIYYKCISALAMLSILIISSCVSDDKIGVNTDSRENNLFLYITVPDNIETQTRALSQDENYKIDLGALRILLFKEGKFTQEVTISTTDSQYDTEENKYKIKINDIERNNDIVDFVVIANNGGFTSPAVGDTKQEFMDKLTFSMNGKWDTKTPRLLPFWGEARDVKLDENLGTRYSKTKFEITLLRALARIDFYSSIDQSGISPTASTLMIKSISVYNSYDRGLMAPDAANIDENSVATEPTLPNNVLFNAGTGAPTSDPNTNPLKYEVSDPLVFDSEIFIPEQKLDGVDKSKKLTFIVGGQTANSSVITYYRIDLHKKNASGDNITLDVLRNHRYIINILGVRGNGAPSEEAALKSVAHNIDVDIVNWDENINEGFIFGDKYLGLNTNALVFPEYNSGQELSLNIQTNLDINQLKENITLKWQNSDRFSGQVTQVGNKIQILVKTLTDNLTPQVLKDILKIQIQSHTFEVEVSQNTTKLAYDILCEKTKIYGIYQKNIPLNQKNYIEVTVQSEEDLSGYRYDISSDRIDNIQFKGEGIFAMTAKNGVYEQVVKLMGAGTARTTVPKFMTITPNSKKYQNCNFEVKMAYTKKTIVGIGHSKYGYSTDNNKGNEPHSYLFRKSPNNFGLTEKSTIKSEVLSDDNFTHIDDANYPSDLNKFKAAMNQNPDILIWGYTGVDDSNSTFQMAAIAAEYVKKGGTMIYMSETINTIDEFFKNLYKGHSKAVNIYSLESGKPGTNYPFITQPGDIITDGPFGSVHGKFWGEDASRTKTVVGIPSEDIVVYSLGIPYGKEAYIEDKGICIFRHTKYNLFFIGDAGFISQGTDNIALGSSTICPFMVNNEHRPIPKDDYGKGSGERRGTVHNAIFFANVLAWAIDRAEFHGINSDK